MWVVLGSKIEFVYKFARRLGMSVSRVQRDALVEFTRKVLWLVKSGRGTDLV